VNFQFNWTVSDLIEFYIIMYISVGFGYGRHKSLPISKSINEVQVDWFDG